VCIQDIGVTPNIEVDSNKETDSIFYEDRTIANDAQLAAAVNAIKK
jgi:C-terminal processing protease CtpA/Prc